MDVQIAELAIRVHLSPPPLSLSLQSSYNILLFRSQLFGVSDSQCFRDTPVLILVS